MLDIDQILDNYIQHKQQGSVEYKNKLYFNYFDKIDKHIY